MAKGRSSKKVNASKAISSKITGWHMNKKCFYCWKFSTDFKPGYNLCRESAKLLWEQAKIESNSSNTSEIQAIFDKNYKQIVKGIEFICRQPGSEIIDPPPVEGEYKYRRCEWCGKGGSRKSKYCVNCQNEVLAPLF